MKRKKLTRIDMADNKAWTLHPKSRGENFTRLLPEIINRIEKGWYPPEQEGLYDLEFDVWEKALNKS